MDPVNNVYFRWLISKDTYSIWHVISQKGKSDLTLRIGTGVVLVWPHHRRMVHEIGIVLLRRVQSLRQDTSLHQNEHMCLRMQTYTRIKTAMMFRSTHCYNSFDIAQDIDKHSAHVYFNKCMHLIVGLSRSAIRKHCHALSAAFCRHYCLFKVECIFS